jgi:ubiquinol-cytochrome c reductase cytochrome b subunit
MELITNFISLIIVLAILVKVFSFYIWNQPVTNGRRYSSYLVGTSETTRVISLSKKEKKEICFNQWLAGLIDGDGCLLISKLGYTSCEITVSLADERLLRIIQNKLGGSIKIRSGVKALRWRLHNRIGMINLINRINGYIRHSGRFIQLSHVCAELNIQVLNPDNLHKTHGWFSGFFDADGTINYYLKGKYPQLTLSVTNKLLVDVIHFKNHFGGEIYFDKSQNGYYKWSIQSKDIINYFIEYSHVCPFQSIKRNRLFLVKDYYRLHNLGAYKALEGSILNKAWNKFNQKWNKSNLS